jgi:hypothetical protein
MSYNVLKITIYLYKKSPKDGKTKFNSFIFF